MKSQVSALLHVESALVKDAQAAYPELKEGLSKDIERLALYSQERGLGLWTLDLPHLESLLLQGLESGRLSLEGPLSTAVSKRIQVPRLYSGLWLRVFERDSTLKTEVDVTALAFLRQLLVLGKKLEVGCSYDRTQAIVRNYHDIEKILRQPTLKWAEDELFGGSQRENSGNLHLLDCLDSRHGVLPLFGPIEDREGGDYRRDQRLLRKCQRVADMIVGRLDHLNPVFESEHWERDGQGTGFKHGPGAVAERLKNWEKSHFRNWSAKLEGYFPYELCGKTRGSDGPRPLNHEVPSRLIAVPKTSKGPRLIAAEPASHQWCQQLLLRFLTEQWVKHFGDKKTKEVYFIDFRDQSKSGDLVLSASRDRSLATVDLSDASDRLSCWTVERMFRNNLPILHALHAARTRYLMDDLSEDRSFLKLKKFASQGTATTFPVMSIIMLVIALASVLDDNFTERDIWEYRTQVRVFGDDIILPAHGYASLLRLMELLELKVNVAKSYVHGYFRESCGIDGYAGYDVTPVKPKTVTADSPASCQAVVDNSNNLYSKGYWNASTAFLDLLPARLRRGIRIMGPHDVGFRGLISYSGGDERHLERRWNPRLHRYEIRVWQLSVRTRQRPRDGFSALLDFFASKHSRESYRTVSEYADARKSRIGLQWEPQNIDACSHPSASGGRPTRSHGSVLSVQPRVNLVDRPLHARMFEPGTGRLRFRTG